MVLGVRRPGLKFYFCQLTTKGPWASHSTSLRPFDHLHNLNSIYLDYDIKTIRYTHALVNCEVSHKGRNNRDDTRQPYTTKARGHWFFSSCNPAMANGGWETPVQCLTLHPRREESD